MEIIVQLADDLAQHPNPGREALEALVHPRLSNWHAFALPSQPTAGTNPIRVRGIPQGPQYLRTRLWGSRSRTRPRDSKGNRV